MTDKRHFGGDDADIDLDTQELVKPAREEPLGYGPGEWASSAPPAEQNSKQARTESNDSDLERRVRNAEAAIETLRTTLTGLEREIALVRADLERLRQETEKVAGSRLP